MGALSGLVFATGTHDLGVQRGEVDFELFAAEVLIADQDQHLAWLAFAATHEFQANLALIDLGGRQRERPGSAVQCEQRVQPEAQKNRE